MMKVIFCTLMGLRVGCRISGLSREFPLSTVYKLWVFHSGVIYSNSKERKNALTDGQYNYYMVTPLCCKRKSSLSKWSLQISNLSEEVPQMTLILTQTRGRMQSGTHMSSMKSGTRKKCRIVCTTMLSVVWCVYARFACMFKQHLAHTSHNSDSSDFACLQTADTDSACPPPSWDEAGGMLGFG